MATATELERLVVTLIADAKQFQGVMDKAEKEIESQVGRIAALCDSAASAAGTGWQKFGVVLENVTKKVEVTAKKLQNAGRMISTYIGAPLALIGALSVREFAKFDNALVESFSIMGDVGPGMKKDMTELAKNMTGDSKFAAHELANAYYYLASAGLDAQQSMASLSVVERFATAGAFDLESATSLLTQSQAAMGLTEKDAMKNRIQMIRISDALVEAGNKSNATVKQFAEALTNDAATAAQAFGMDLEQTVALLESYAQKGIMGADAGSSLGRAIRLLSKAFQDHGEVFKKQGIEVVDKATGEYRRFNDVIADMEKRFEHMTGPQRAAALEMLGFEALAQRAILPLVGMSKQTKEFEDDLRSMGGVTEDVANRQMESFLNQIKRIRNQLVVIAIEIGAVLAPKLLWLSENIIKPGIEWWQKLSDEAKTFIVLCGAIAVAAGPVLVVLGLLGSATAGIVAGLTALVTVAGAIGAPILFAVGAMGALAAIMGTLTLYGSDANTTFSKFADAMIQNLAVGVNVAGKLFDAFKIYLAQLFDDIFSGDLPKAMLKGMSKTYKIFSEFYDNLKTRVLTGKGISFEDLLGLNDPDLANKSSTQQFIGNVTSILKEGLHDLKNPLEGMFGPVDGETKSLAEATGEKFARDVANGIQNSSGAIKGAINDAFPDEDVTKLTEKLKEQIATFGMSTHEAKVYKLAMHGVSQEQLTELNALDAQLTALDKYKKQQKEATKLTKDFRDPMHEFNDEQKRLKELLDAGMIDFEVYANALKKVHKETSKDYAIDLKVKGVDAAVKGSAEAAEHIEKYLAVMNDKKTKNGVAMPDLNRILANDAPAGTTGAIGLAMGNGLMNDADSATESMHGGKRRRKRMGSANPLQMHGSSDEGITSLSSVALQEVIDNNERSKPKFGFAGVTSDESVASAFGKKDDTEKLEELLQKVVENTTPSKTDTVIMKRAKI